MNFLSNLWSGIKNVTSNVGSYLGNQTASVINTLGFGSSPLSPGNQTAPNMSYAPPPTPDPWKYAPQPSGSGPNMSTPYGPGSVNNQGQLVIYNSNGTVNPLSSIMANSGTVGGGASGVRPSTYTPTSTSTGPAGQRSTPEVGQPYYKGDTLITPKAGFSGLSGTGGIGGTQTTTPMTTGLAGLAGGGTSAHTGLLGAVGTTATGQPSSDELTPEQIAAQRNTQILATDSPYTASAVQNIKSSANASPFVAPSVPDVIDAGFISDMQKSINELTSLSGSISGDERTQYINQLSQNLITAKQKLDTQVPIPENPVVDTKEQFEFINANEDQFGVKQAMDQFRAESTNLAQLQNTRIDLMKNIQALNAAYSPIIKDIKMNPDLPKALARRRLEDLATTQKETLQGFLDQLKIVTQQISDQNEIVNRAFQIQTFASNQQNQQEDNLRASLQLMVSSGAIAGFTEEEIARYSGLMGISVSALRTMKKTALEEKAEIITNEDVKGNLVGVDKNTGKIVWSVPGFAKPTGDTGGGANDVNTFAQSYLNGDIDISSVPQNIRAQVLAKANEIAVAALNQPAETTTTTSTKSLTAKEAGQGLRASPYVQALKPSNLWAGNTKVMTGIGDFFKGLVGF